MLRHQLNSLFEPRSLLLVGPANLAFMGATLPAALQACTTRLVLEAEETPQLPSQLQGLADKQRLDLAVVCVSPDQLPLLLDALSVFRPRVLVVLSSAQAAADSYELLAFCRSWGLLNDCQVLGPRSFGLQLPHKTLNLSHAPQLAGAGRVALVAQSSTLVFALLDWAADVNMGFSAVISLGHEAGISVADVLDYLVSDPHTDSIALYLKETPRIRRLASALRAVAAVKPVVILRPRHRRQGLADRTEDAVFNTLLRRTGAVRVPYFIQLFSALRVLRYKKRPQGPRVVLLSNSRGAAQLALDVIGPGYSISRADLNQSTRHKLQALLAPGSTTESPVISVSPFTPESLSAVVALLMADEGVDGILALLTPDPLADTDALAKQLIHEAQNGKKPLVSCLLGESSMRSLRQQFDQAQVPVFRTPESAAGAFGILAAHQYNQNLSRQILPPEPLQRPPSLNKARNILNEARSDKRYRLLSDECRQLFQCFSIPIDITVLPKGVAGPPAGFQFASDLPSMAIRVLRSPHIGPYLRFGASGLIGRPDSDAFELPPLNRFLARQLVERSEIWKQGLSTDLSPVALETLLDALQHLSDMVARLSSIESLEINPLYADSMGLTAGQVVVNLSEQPATLPESAGYPHMAIHPYPRELVQSRELRDGRHWVMRPIRPEDALPLQQFIRGLSPETRYMRFVSMLRELTPQMLSRYTRIDYDRELAIVAAMRVPNPEHRGHSHDQIIGFAHYLRNADSRGAEIALVVGDDWQRQGLGKQLLGGLIQAARWQEFTYLDGYVLPSNTAMLALMQGQGFVEQAESDDPEMRYLVLDLSASEAGATV